MSLSNNCQMSNKSRNMSAKRKARENANSETEDQSKVPKNVYLIAQDIKFAKVLACNNKKLRDRALKSLKKWFQHRSNKLPFTEDDLMRIWKGLFYSMWMSDKPLIQEEVAENIASLIHYVDSELSSLFFKTGLLTLMQQWNGIDQFRLDKFLMFTRRLLRQAIIVLKNHKWKRNVVNKFCDTLTETVLNTDINPPLGLTMHITDIYLEEIAKVSEGKIHPSLTTQFIKPFVGYLAILNDKTQINHVKENIFHYLLKQSEAAAAFEERYEAWKKMGFPGGTIDAVTKEYVDESEENDAEENGNEEDEEKTEKVLDPRAGRVDVELPRLKFSAKEIASVLQEHKFVDGSNTKAKKAINLLIHQFKEMAKGNYPLGMKKLNLVKDDNYSTKLKHSVNRLVKFEKKLMGTDKKKGKKRKTIDETPVEQPKKKKKVNNHKLNGSNNFAHDFFQKQLEDFVRRSEGSPNRKPQVKKETPKNFDYSFRRNSGTWFVYNEDKNEQNTDKNSGNSEEESQVTSSLNDKPSCSKNIKKSKTNDSTPKRKQLFHTDEWETPLQDGETEIFIPAKKRSKSLEKINTSFTETKHTSVKNPFAKNNTPRSAKKVKIDLKLNTSQEFHEHHAQILSSPAIPFDASKKPLKPLLKPSAVSSPVSPFYKKRRLFATGDTTL